MDTILNDPAGVRGIIYCVEHAASGKKYVGTAHSVQRVGSVIT
jgi:hypothetical protein